MKFITRFSFIAVLLFIILAWIVGPNCAHCSRASNRGPSANALQAGVAAFTRHRNIIRKTRIWTLIDYDLPFTAIRLWVVEMRQKPKVLIASRVSHAWKSGLLFARRFSNRPGSNLSSIGSYVTANKTYEGRFGHSLRVRGLDSGINHNAWRRDIVIHPDLGMTHSLGCFMLPNATARPIIDMIAGSSFVYVHRTTGPREE